MNHNIVGPPRNRLNIPIEAYVNLDESVVNFLIQFNKLFGADSDSIKECPYQVGDRVDFWSSCSVCDNMATCKVNESPICVRCSADEYLIQASKVTYVKPEARVVSSVTTGEIKGTLSWIVELKNDC